MSDRCASRRVGGGRPRWFRLAAACVAAVGLPLLLTNCEALLPQQAWNGDWGPLVPHENFPGDCSLCHHPGGWDRIKSDFTFDHAAETGFALVGEHEDAMCLRCHNDRGPVEEFAARGCGGCHIDPHRTQLGPDCEQCHDEESWTPHGIIEDHASTRLPLMGAHLATPCEACHPGSSHGDFKGAPTLCEVCHAEDLARAVAPDHLSSGLTNDCERCHTVFGWQGADFEHDFFALVGGHAGHACEACHPGGSFAGTSSACFSCHANDFAAAPGHASYSTQCQDCHDVFDWGNAAIDHSFFPLVGGHAAPACEQCHPGGDFAGTSNACFSCHSQDYAGAPGHSSYSTQCQDCHDVFAWDNATLDHSFFPLIGGHSVPGCEQCHPGGVFAGTSNACFSCHATDFASAPGHTTFSTQCQDCHDIFDWNNAAVDHSFFPLQGGHATPACEQCHPGGQFAGTSNACFSCHAQDYASAPGHASYSTQCQDCHDIFDWSNATIDHSFFPLNGGHSGHTCDTCHQPGTYQGLSSSCISCHQSDYNGAPDHVALSFSQDCEQCHTIFDWNSNFVHGFPLSGPHNQSCTTCHVSGTTTNFSCYGTCHEHSQGQTNDDHSGVSGYSYSFPACVDCHPNGD